MRILILFLICLSLGCTGSTRSAHEALYLVPLETLSAELKNANYEWHGPTSCEDRIPTLDAACALAYRGDDAAATLFDALDDAEIEIFSVMDALSELGMPTHEYHDQIMARDSSGLRNWWIENQESTRADRNNHRLQIGLPPSQIGG